MKRRTVVALLGALPFGGSTMLRRVLAAPGQQPPGRTLAALADTMFPGGDGLPAASELSLHERALALPDLAETMASGTAWLDRYATSHGVADFVALDDVGRLAALDAAFASGEKDVRSFVLAVRQRLGLAYYADPAIKKAFAYTGPPQPDGFPDYQERPA